MNRFPGIKSFIHENEERKFIILKPQTDDISLQFDIIFQIENPTLTMTKV